MNNKAVLFRDLERYAEALRIYDHALTLEPAEPILWANKAMLLADLGLEEGSLDAFEEALELDPNNGLTWFYKGSILFDMFRYREALNAYDRALETPLANEEEEFYINVYMSKGAAFFRIGNYSESAESYGKVLVIRPNHSDANEFRNRSLRLAEQY